MKAKDFDKKFDDGEDILKICLSGWLRKILWVVWSGTRSFCRGPAFQRALGLMIHAKNWPEYDTLCSVAKVV